jgi:hypothetical protein
VLNSLSVEARRRLAELDVHFDEQLRGLDLDTLELSLEDATRLRHAIAEFPVTSAPPDLSGLTGVTEEEIDLDVFERPKESS